MSAMVVAPSVERSHEQDSRTMMIDTPYRALVVDDEVMIRQLVIRALSRAGLACDGASSGAEARVLAETTRYDVVVTDLRMPECNGHALAVELLAKPQRPVIVVHTGVLEPRLARDLIARGVDDLIFKPASHEVLAAKVVSLIQRRQATSSLAEVPDSVSEAANVHPGSRSGPGVRPADMRGSAARIHAVRESERRMQPHARRNVGSTESLHDAATMPRRVEAAELRAKTLQLKQILPISQTAMDVFEMTNSGEHDAERIAVAVTRDPSLCVEVLRLSNSAFYNRSGKRITDLEDAVALLGQKRIGELAVASNAMGALAIGALPWMDVPLAWRRSVAYGLALEALLEQGEHRDGERGLTLCAMMHDLGRVMLATLFPEKYKSMVQVAAERAEPLGKLEAKVFPGSHTVFLADLLDAWNIPKEICEPLRFVSEDTSRQKPLAQNLDVRVGLVRLAVAVGRMAVGHWEPWDEISQVTSDQLVALSIADIDSIIQCVRQGVAELAADKSHESEGGAEGRDDSRNAAERRRVAYCNVSRSPVDCIVELMRAEETLELVPVAPNRLERPVAINAVSVSAEELARCVPADLLERCLVIVGGQTTGHDSEFRHVISLSSSCGALRNAIAAVADRH